MLALLSLLAVPGAAAPAVPAPAPAQAPDYYICRVDRQGAQGGISWTMDVPINGGTPFHRINWGIPLRPVGLRLWVQWDGTTPPDGRIEDRAWVSIYFRAAIPARGEARIEIRRQSGERYAGEFAYAGPYRPLYREGQGNPLYREGQGNPLYREGQGNIAYVDTQARWGELNAWMSGREAITFALVARDGRVLAEDRLEARTLAGAAAALVAAKPEMDAMVADYRNRCAVPEDIVVT